jgi:hypothetical protein
LISENKGIADAFGEWGTGELQDAGDSITAFALVVAPFNPVAGAAMSKFGGAMSTTGSVLELTNDGMEWNMKRFFIAGQP